MRFFLDLQVIPVRLCWTKKCAKNYTQNKACNKISTYSAAINIPNPVLVVIVVNTLKASYNAMVGTCNVEVLFEIVDPVPLSVPAILYAIIPLAAMLVCASSHVLAIKAPPE